MRPVFRYLQTVGRIRYGHYSGITLQLRLD
jgi:hypothetical protein